MKTNQIIIQEIDSHRNGVCGEPFWAIRFFWAPEDDKPMESFLAIVHEEPGYCSVIGLDRIEEMGIKFAGGNSWRGDHLEDDLREAISDARAAKLT
jgi:hypothetical protein